MRKDVQHSSLAGLKLANNSPGDEMEYKMRTQEDEKMHLGTQDQSSERTQSGIRNHFQRLRVAVSILMLIAIVLIAACAQTRYVSSISIGNMRFEPVQLPHEIELSRRYWMKKGELIAPKMDNFVLDYEEYEACDLCTNPNCGGAGASVNGDPLTVHFTKDSVSDEKEMVINYAGGPGACTVNLYSQVSPPNAPVDEDGSFELVLGEGFDISFFGLMETDVSVNSVEAGLEETFREDLRTNTIDGTDYWVWTVGGNPVWDLNFSPSLRVKDIRVINAADSRPIKPSRVLFLPNFESFNSVSSHPAEALNRCYHSEENLGSYINLEACRNRNDDPIGSGLPRITTPTYYSDPSAIAVDPDLPNKKLTWLLEFNTNEGADFDPSTENTNDPVPPGTSLRIEFTVAAQS